MKAFVVVLNWWSKNVLDHPTQSKVWITRMLCILVDPRSIMEYICPNLTVRYIEKQLDMVK